VKVFNRLINQSLTVICNRFYLWNIPPRLGKLLVELVVDGPTWQWWKLLIVISCSSFIIISLKLLQFFRVTVRKSICYYFKIIRNNDFSVTMETDIIFTCKYFKFGLNTTGLSQSHFKNLSACSIKNVIYSFGKKYATFFRYSCCLVCQSVKRYVFGCAPRGIFL